MTTRRAASLFASASSNKRAITKLLQRIQKDFSEHSDTTKAEYMANYMRKSPPTLYHGLQTPERRAIQSEALKQADDLVIESDADYRALLGAFWEQPHREEKHFAIDLALMHKRHISIDNLPHYEAMLRADWMWWDFCDPLAINCVGRLALDRWDDMFPILERWISDDNRWIRRTAIIAQLKHKERTHPDVLEEFILRRCHEKEFFIRKAIGWALREYGKTNPRRVKVFLVKHKTRLSTLSYREGSRILIKNGVMSTTEAKK